MEKELMTCGQGNERHEDQPENPTRRSFMARLLALGAAAYVAPTLFSLNEAQAGSPPSRRSPRSRRSPYTRPSRSGLYARQLAKKRKKKKKGAKKAAAKRY